MTRLLAASSPGEVRVAAIVDGVLQDYAIWRPGRPDGVGDVYRARVIAHVPGMAGAFVSLPDGDGFLPDSEGGAKAVGGALVTVRVTRAAQGGKGARVSAKVAQMMGEPGLVTAGPSPVAELAERYPDASIEVDDPALAVELQPALKRVITIVPGALAPFAEAIDGLSDTEIALPAGMRASIHPTPALVAIDLDMAAATADRGGKKRTQMAANLAAIPALVRQIRLRNLSGAILIDPAGISVKRRELLAPALTEALAADPLGARLVGFTGLGLVEIQRVRRRPALHELLEGAHAAGLSALRAMVRECMAAPSATMRLAAAPDVVAALERDTVARADLVRRVGRALIARPDPALAPGGWRIERVA